MSGDVTLGYLHKISYRPDDGVYGNVIGGQDHWDVNFTGGTIDGCNIENCTISNTNNFGWGVTTSDVLNFYSWSPSSIGATGDLTTVIQNFLLECQLLALTLKTSGLDNLAQRSCVNAYFPRGRYSISCPIVVPEYVNMIMDGVLVRTGSSGTATAAYTGDTTTKALANLSQASVMIAPRGHCERLSLVCNSNGSDRGSGLSIGKNWTMGSVSITEPGSGYQVGDLLTFNQPSLSPYIAATATVSSINGSGGITGIGLTEYGAYGLPPVQQKSQWTAANGFSVFDAYGNIGVTGGHGSGASIANTWQNDFISNAYVAGRGGLISDTTLGRINIVQSQRLDDPTYGQVFLFQQNGLNTVWDEFEGESGFYSIWFRYCADIRINRLNVVNGETNLICYNATSIECPNVVVDTPTGGAPPIQIDQSGGLRFAGRIFNRDLTDYPSTPRYAAIGIGYFTGTTYSYDISLDFTIYGGGTGGDSTHISEIGAPALYLNYVVSFDINLTVSNRPLTFTGLWPVVSSFCTFGSNVGPGRIRGSIDHTFGSLFTGTIPTLIDIDIWDADVSIVNGSITCTIGGTVTTGDKVSITFTNPVFASTYAWPRTISYTAAAGNSVTNIAAGLVAAIAADAALSINGIKASNSSGVITIVQMGIDANNTTLSASVSGSATETVTFSNSGAISGSISGGRVKGGGIYELTGSGAPTNGTTGTGWGKAPAGSKYTDISAGNLYINTGSASSPSWSQLT